MGKPLGKGLLVYRWHGFIWRILGICGLLGYAEIYEKRGGLGEFVKEFGYVVD